jgi:phosphoglycerate kinase
MSVLKMADLDLSGKRVLIREDLNVPVKDGKISSDARIVASLPTIRLALEKGAAVMVCSHLGRPVEGEFSAENSLQPVADYLSEALGRPVPLVGSYVDGFSVQAGRGRAVRERALQQGREEEQRRTGAKIRRALRCVRDGRLRHRPPRRGSTHGVAKFAPIACAGPLLAAELEALAKALTIPPRR